MMKNLLRKTAIIVAVLMLLNYSDSSAQDLSYRDVPSVILNAFQTKFRNARDVEWEYKHGYYEVEFEIGQREFEIKYDPKGNILYYEEELDGKQLPAAIQQTIRSKYPGFYIKEAEKKDSGRVTFKVELKNNSGEEWELILSPSGKILTKKLD